MRPGRPTSASTTPNGKLLLALPGRPAALLTALHALLRPLLDTMQGNSAPPPHGARLTATLSPAAVTRYLPVRLECRNGTLWASAQELEAEYADALLTVPAGIRVDGGTPLAVFRLG